MGMCCKVKVTGRATCNMCTGDNTTTRWPEEDLATGDHLAREVTGEGPYHRTGGYSTSNWWLSDGSTQWRVLYNPNVDCTSSGALVSIIQVPGVVQQEDGCIAMVSLSTLHCWDSLQTIVDQEYGFEKCAVMQDRKVWGKLCPIGCNQVYEML